jgi:hypothetical protein
MAGSFLRLVASHLVFSDLGGRRSFFTFVGHQKPLKKDVNSPRIEAPVLDL